MTYRHELKQGETIQILPVGDASLELRLVRGGEIIGSVTRELLELRIERPVPLAHEADGTVIHVDFTRKDVTNG